MLLLRVGLCREEDRALALLTGSLLGLGSLKSLFPLSLLEEEASLFGLGAPIRDVEELHYGGERVVNAKLLEHPGVLDARPEGKDDLSVRDVRDLVADLAEVLDVPTEGLARPLACNVKVIVGEGALVRALEVGHESLAEVLPRVDGVLREVVEP